MDDDLHDDRRESTADPQHMDTACPSCGHRMRPIDLGSGAVVLRCPRCGQTAI